MKTHNTKRIYRARCQSGLIGWRTRLQNNYSSLKEWQDYSAARGLAGKLGFRSARAAWEENPVIEGSANPSDFRKVAP